MNNLGTNDFYRNILHLTDAHLIDRLVKISEPLRLNKGDILVREGEKQDHFVLLVSGILRGYFLDVNGRDVTDCFGYVCGSPAMSCFSIAEPSPISIAALTNCDLIQLPSDRLLALMQDEPQLVWLYNKMLQESLRMHWNIKTNVCQHSAMERYEWFLEAYPGLIDRVSNKYVASFLGMTPVTLSRLRRTLRERSGQPVQSVSHAGYRSIIHDMGSSQ